MQPVWRGQHPLGNWVLPRVRWTKAMGSSSSKWRLCASSNNIAVTWALRPNSYARQEIALIWDTAGFGQDSERQRQISNRRLRVLRISTQPLNFPKMGVFHPKFRTFGRKFSGQKMFRQEKFMRGASVFTDNNITVNKLHTVVNQMMNQMLASSADLRWTQQSAFTTGNRQLQHGKVNGIQNFH